MSVDIPEDILTVLRDNLRRRDELAMKLGVATFEYEKQKSLYERLLTENLKEEQRLKEAWSEREGLDPQKNYTINLKDGLLEEN